MSTPSPSSTVSSTPSSDAPLPFPRTRVRVPTVLQMEETECGAASLGMVLAHAGRVVPLEELREACGVSRDGSNASMMLKAARAYGMEAKGFRRPYAKLAEGNLLPQILFWRYSHWVVLEGYGKDSLLINDPAEGRLRVPLADAERLYSGVALHAAPGPEFVQGGRRRSWLADLIARIRPSRLGFGLAAAAGLFLVVPGVMLPMFTTVFVDTVLGTGLSGNAAVLIGAVLLVSLLIGTLTLVQQWFLARLQTRLTVSGSFRLVDHLLKLPVQYFTQRFPGVLVSRLDQIDSIALLLAGPLVTAGVATVGLIVYAIVMVAYSPLLTVLAVVASLLNVVALYYVSRRRDAANQLQLRESSRLTGLGMSMVANIEAIKTAGGEDAAFERWAGFQARSLLANQDMGRLTNGLSVVPTTLASLTSVLVLAIGGLDVARGGLSLGLLVGFQALMASFLSPIGQLVALAQQAQTAQGQLVQVNDVLNAKIEDQFVDRPDAGSLVAGPQTATARATVTRREVERLRGPRLNGALELRNIEFGYTRVGEPLISDFNLSIAPGSRVALVGASGSGKSTSRQADPRPVRTLERRHPVRRPPRQAWDRAHDHHLGVVRRPADHAVRRARCRDNLTLWDTSVATERPDRGRPRRLHPRRHRHAAPAATSRPIEGGGRNFSGGQRQRLEIARALVAGPQHPGAGRSHQRAGHRDRADDRPQSATPGRDLPDRRPPASAPSATATRSSCSSAARSCSAAPTKQLIALGGRYAATGGGGMSTRPASEMPTAGIPSEDDYADIRRLDASTPLALTDPDTAWYLTAGEVDLFVVPVDDGGLTGRRGYVATATAGTLLLGSEPIIQDGRRWQLWAVGVNATASRQRPGWWDGPVGANQYSQGLHQWLTTLGSALPAAGPRRAVEAAATRVTAGDVIDSPDGLVWCLPTADRALRLAGAMITDPVPIPVSAAFCLETAADSELQIVASVDVGADLQRAGLACTHRLLVRGCAQSAIARADRSAARGADRHRLDEDARRGALGQFERIDDDARWAPSASDDKVLAACLLLGRAAGIEIATPPDWSRSLSVDPVRAVARASGVRVRTVTLSGAWWRNSLEPMLAFAEPQGDPVVLVPGHSSRYLVVNPSTGAESRITPAYAEQLRPTAYVLYRPMPPGSVTIRGLLGFGLRDSGRDLLRLMAFSLVAGVLSLALPVATGTILGRLVPVGSSAQVLLAALLLLIVVMATTGFLLSRSASLLRLQGRMLTRMQSGMWDRLIALPVGFYTRYSPADLSQRVNGVDAIQQIVSSVASQTLLAVITLVFSLGLLFFYDAALAAAVLIATLVVVSISAVVTVAQIRRLRVMYEAKGRSAGVLLQIVQGMDKIRAAAAENRALRAWTDRFAEQAQMLLSSERLSAVRAGLYAMLPSLLTVIVFAAVARDPGTMSTAAFLAFITALGQIAGATTQLDLSFGYMLNLLPIFDRMRPILSEEVEVMPGAGDPGLLAGRVELAAVTYRYPGMQDPVLHEVSFTAEPGEFVALVGPSGSGKSTVVRLLLGFDHPESGSVTFDDKDLAVLDGRAVRAQIGVALQNASVTGGDILSVITGDWPLTEADAWVAAARVGLADDIKALPMGMRTMIGDNAVTFSGGQRQRLVLAAALARNPRLVILDEATSALDSVTQSIVAESFDQLQVTRVVVAHRLSTIRNADKVIVLDGGRIAQQGSYAELAATPGIFADMVRRQTL